MRRFVLLAALLASPACLLGVPGLIEETEPDGCQVGDTMVCYEGAEGTQDVGICRAGAGVCDEEGEVAQCEGQVLPRVEVCRSDDDFDEDCDGEVNDHCALWSKSFGGDGADRLVGLTTLDDTVIISGDYAEEIDLGGETFDHGSSGGFVARFDENGEHMWSIDVGGSSSERAATLVTSSNRLLVGGNFQGTLTIGEQELMSGSADRDLFVAALMPENGEEDWVKSFGETKSSVVHNIAVFGEDEHIVGVGEFTGDIVFGSVPMLTATDGSDAVIFALDSDGEPLWAKSGGGMGDDVARGVAVIDDTIYVSGWAHDELDLGCSETVTSDGDGDPFVAALDGADGSCKWLLHMAAEGLGRARALDTDGTRLFVGVDFEGTLTLPDGAAFTSAGELDVAIFAMTPTREVIWSRQFGDDEKQDVFVAAADGEGGVLIGGATAGTPDLGEGQIISQDVGEDAYAIRLDEIGEVLWARSFGGDGDDDTINAAFSSSGLLYIGGEVNISMDLGAGLLQATTNDAFVARIAP